MIIEKEGSYKEVKFEGDNLHMFEAIRVPDEQMKIIQMFRDTPGLKYMDNEKEWHWVARIPKLIYNQLMHDYPDEMKDPESRFLLEWLDKPENQIWKMFSGRAS